METVHPSKVPREEEKSSEPKKVLHEYVRTTEDGSIEVVQEMVLESELARRQAAVCGVPLNRNWEMGDSFGDEEDDSEETSPSSTFESIPLPKASDGWTPGSCREKEAEQTAPAKRKSVDMSENQDITLSRNHSETLPAGESPAPEAASVDQGQESDLNLVISSVSTVREEEEKSSESTAQLKQEGGDGGNTPETTTEATRETTKEDGAVEISGTFIPTLLTDFDTESLPIAQLRPQLGPLSLSDNENSNMSTSSSTISAQSTTSKQSANKSGAKKGKRGNAWTKKNRPKPKPDKMVHGHVRTVNLNEVRQRTLQDKDLSADNQGQGGVQLPEPDLHPEDPSEDDFHNFDVDFDINTPSPSIGEIIFPNVRQSSETIDWRAAANDPAYQPFVRLVDYQLKEMSELPKGSYQARSRSLSPGYSPLGGRGQTRYAWTFGPKPKKKPEQVIPTWNPAQRKLLAIRKRGPNFARKSVTHIPLRPVKISHPSFAASSGSSSLSFTTTTLPGSMVSLCPTGSWAAPSSKLTDLPPSSEKKDKDNNKDEDKENSENSDPLQEKGQGHETSSTPESTGPSPTEENTCQSPTVERTIPNPTEENTVPNPTEENTAPNPTEENTAPSPTKINTAPSLAEENTGPSPTVDSTGPSPTVESIGPSPTVKSTEPSPTIESSDVSPTAEEAAGVNQSTNSDTSPRKAPVLAVGKTKPKGKNQRGTGEKRRATLRKRKPRAGRDTPEMSSSGTETSGGGGRKKKEKEKVTEKVKILPVRRGRSLANIIQDETIVDVMRLEEYQAKRKTKGKTNNKGSETSRTEKSPKNAAKINIPIEPFFNPQIPLIRIDPTYVERTMYKPEIPGILEEGPTESPKSKEKLKNKKLVPSKKPKKKNATPSDVKPKEADEKPEDPKDKEVKEESKAKSDSTVGAGTSTDPLQLVSEDHTFLEILQAKLKLAKTEIEAESLKTVISLYIKDKPKEEQPASSKEGSGKEDEKAKVSKPPIDIKLDDHDYEDEVEGAPDTKPVIKEPVTEPICIEEEEDTEITLNNSLHEVQGGGEIETLQDERWKIIHALEDLEEIGVDEPASPVIPEAGDDGRKKKTVSVKSTERHQANQDNGDEGHHSKRKRKKKRYRHRKEGSFRHVDHPSRDSERNRGPQTPEASGTQRESEVKTKTPPKKVLYTDSQVIRDMITAKATTKQQSKPNLFDGYGNEGSDSLNVSSDPEQWLQQLKHINEAVETVGGTDVLERILASTKSLEKSAETTKEGTDTQPSEIEGDMAKNNESSDKDKVLSDSTGHAKPGKTKLNLKTYRARVAETKPPEEKKLDSGPSAVNTTPMVPTKQQQSQQAEPKQQEASKQEQQPAKRQQTIQHQQQSLQKQPLLKQPLLKQPLLQQPLQQQPQQQTQSQTQPQTMPIDLPDDPAMSDILPKIPDILQTEEMIKILQTVQMNEALQKQNPEPQKAAKGPASRDPRVLMGAHSATPGQANETGPRSLGGKKGTDVRVNYLEKNLENIRVKRKEYINTMNELKKRQVTSGKAREKLDQEIYVLDHFIIGLYLDEEIVKRAMDKMRGTVRALPNQPVPAELLLPEEVKAMKTLKKVPLILMEKLLTEKYDILNSLKVNRRQI